MSLGYYWASRFCGIESTAAAHLFPWTIVRPEQDITHQALHQPASTGSPANWRGRSAVFGGGGVRDEGGVERQMVIISGGEQALNEALTSELTAVVQTDNPTWQTARQHYLFWIYDGRRRDSLCRLRGRRSGKGQILNLPASTNDTI